MLSAGIVWDAMANPHALMLQSAFAAAENMRWGVEQNRTEQNMMIVD